MEHGSLCVFILRPVILVLVDNILKLLQSVETHTK
jgi:hypothetical protein